MQVFARQENVPVNWNGEDGALLLEGSWKGRTRRAQHDSLDETIDARHAWIDDEAVRIAGLLADGHECADLRLGCLPTGLLAHLGGLRLRYFLVKLLRWVAYCREVRRPLASELWELHASQGDDDYVELFGELCHRYRVQGRVLQAGFKVVDATQAPSSSTHWRRHVANWLAKSAESTTKHARNAFDVGCHWRPVRQCGIDTFSKPVSGTGGQAASGTRRLLLCGDLEFLSPLADAWRHRGGETAGLCDEPIIKLRLRQPQLRQLMCEGFRGRENRFDAVLPLGTLTIDNMNLGRPLTRWLNATRCTCGPRWSRWLWAMDRHFAAWRPDALVLSEDATPFTRAAVWTARRHGVPSIVAQHGAPCLQFGFAPLAADWMAAWDEPSRTQFLDWGLSEERVVITGSLPLERSRRRLTGGSRPSKKTSRTVLILANLPARDDRPDGVAFHLTRDTHEAMLRAALVACASVAGLRVIVKLHPRQQGDEPWPRLLQEFPDLPVQLVRRGRWTEYLSQSHAVLSCASSAGVEAARLGWPVVQLLPQGCAGILPARRWGLLGSAVTADELRPLLHKALKTQIQSRPNAFPSECSAVALLANFVDRAIDVAHQSPPADCVSEESLCLRT